MPTAFRLWPILDDIFITSRTQPKSEGSEYTGIKQKCHVINIPTYVMLKDGLASWSAAEAITCCGKPAKESASLV